jgi:hypothetical protein
MKIRLSKREWYARGGFAANFLYRRMRGGSWTYWRVAP